MDKKHQVKLILSGLLSENVKDKAFESALRRILFSDVVDYDFVWAVLKASMPELELHKIEQYEKDTALPVDHTRGRSKLFKS